jgi:DNA-binding NarL/FixJ family response regulator
MAYADPTSPGRLPPSLLIIDDQVLVREGLARLLRCAPIELACVHAVANAAEALAYSRNTPPNLVLLDVDLDGEDGLALLPKLVHHAQVMVLTCLADPATRARAFGLGASAFVCKHEPAARVIDEVQALAARYLAGQGQEVPPMRMGAESLASPGASSDARPRPDA